MAKEYLVMAQHRYQQKDRKATNVAMVQETGWKRTYPSLKAAKEAMDTYLEKWNKPRRYDADGKRRETYDAGGGIGVTDVITPDTDNNMMVVAWKIVSREVTPWKTEEKWSEENS